LGSTTSKSAVRIFKVSVNGLRKNIIGSPQPIDINIDFGMSKLVLIDSV